MALGKSRHAALLWRYAQRTPRPAAQMVLRCEIIDHNPTFSLLQARYFTNLQPTNSFLSPRKEAPLSLPVKAAKADLENESQNVTEKQKPVNLKEQVKDLGRMIKATDHALNDMEIEIQQQAAQEIINVHERMKDIWRMTRATEHALKDIETGVNKQTVPEPSRLNGLNKDRPSDSAADLKHTESKAAANRTLLPTDNLPFNDQIREAREAELDSQLASIPDFLVFDSNPAAQQHDYKVSHVTHDLISQTRRLAKHNYEYQPPSVPANPGAQANLPKQDTTQLSSISSNAKPQHDYQSPNLRGRAVPHTMPPVQDTPQP